MRLHDEDIRTREVLSWTGLHLFHFEQSSCSQKLRIFLDLKCLKWEAHHVDLLANGNVNPWYLGINPRGLVPVLVHDGAVHIESNDILAHLEQAFPTPRLIPVGAEHDVARLLKHEDDLHFDLRNLSFRFVFAPPGSPKSEEVLAVYASAGSGSVGGAADRGLDDQIAYWRRYASEGGVPDAAARTSAARFRAAFDELEGRLATQTYLFGDALSVVDIAWFIYVDRLIHAGYPFVRLHPRVADWFERLSEQPAFARERAVSGQMTDHVAALHRAQAATGTTLEQVAAL